MKKRTANERALPELTQEWKERNTVSPEQEMPATVAVHFDESALQSSKRQANDARQKFRDDKLLQLEGEAASEYQTHHHDLHYNIIERLDMQQRGSIFFAVMEHYGSLPTDERKANFTRDLTTSGLSKEEQIAQIERFDDMMLLYDEKQQANQMARQLAARGSAQSGITTLSQGGAAASVDCLEAASEGLKQTNTSKNSSVLSGGGGGGGYEEGSMVTSITTPSPSIQFSSSGDVAPVSEIQGGITQIKETLASFSSSSAAPNIKVNQASKAKQKEGRNSTER